MVRPLGSLEAIAPEYAATITAAVSRWSIKPFTLGGKAVHACSRFPLGYPADRITAPLQIRIKNMPSAEAPNVASPQNVTPQLLEGSRIAGDKAIIPDDSTKIEIGQAKLAKLVGSFKLCVSDVGEPTSVTILKSTGFPAYDRKIVTTMKNTWKYRPYMVNGNAVNVCTAVTFIYSQK